MPGTAKAQSITGSKCSTWLGANRYLGSAALGIYPMGGRTASLVVEGEGITFMGMPPFLADA